MKSRGLAALALAALLPACGPSGDGAVVTATPPGGPPDLIYGITRGGVLVEFTVSQPQIILRGRTVTGLGAGELIMAMDLDPLTRQLVAMTHQGPFYRIDPQTAVATKVGTATVSPTVSGMDIDPVTGLIRLINSLGTHVSIDQATGATLATHTSPAGVQIEGLAYTNNVAGAAVTTLYGFEFYSQKLVRIGGADGTPSPDGASITPIGSPGFTVGDPTGFDIAGNGEAYVTFPWMMNQVPTASRLLRIDLTTGTQTYLGEIGVSGLILVAIAAAF
jgi:uncharacterized protein DUF4394